MIRGALAVFAALLAGCAGPSAHSRAGGAVVAPLTLRAIPWNPTNAALGHVRSVADAGEVVAVCSDTGATVLASRAVVARDDALTGCVDVASVTGADGAPRWLVAIDAKGRVRHLRDARTFEDVSERYGLGAAKVRGVSPLGGTRVGFLTGEGVAIADGSAVARYGLGPFADFAGGAGLGAGVAADGVHVVDSAHRTTTFFALPGATRAAIDPRGRLYATTAHALYAGDDKGALRLVYDTGDSALHGLVASGDTVWFADGAELGVVDGANVAETSGAGVRADATLAPSATGDVWVVSNGGLARYGRVTSQATLGAAWSDTLAPIFARSCAACHQADGVSGTDLSTPAAWQSARDAVRERVVVSRSMPPDGHPLSDADRAAIRSWTDAGGSRAP